MSDPAGMAPQNLSRAGFFVSGDRRDVTQIGVYRGAAVDITPITAYEQFIGREVDYVLAFMADDPSWSQFEAGALQGTTNGPAGRNIAADWVPILGARKLMLAVPACCVGTSWTMEGSGVNDAHWAALARNLVTAGLGDCVLRIGREFNGSWYRWKVTPGTAAGYLVAYPRIVTTMRAAGFRGTFMWNPYIGQGNFGPSSGVEAVYPGDGFVDVIGLDLYDGVYPPGEVLRTESQQHATWATLRDQWDGLTGWLQLAFTHHKPLAYPEWGLELWNSGGQYSGGGDNAVLIKEMAAWMQDTGAQMHALWEDPGMGVADPDDLPRRLVAAPQARAAFLAAFGRSN